MKKSMILIIEDDDLQYEIYEEALAEYPLTRATTGSGALAQIARQRPDLLILDHVLAEGELGLDFLPELKELLPFVPIIIVSGALEVHQQMKALQGPRRAHYCLPKPVDIHELKRTVEIALAECGERKSSRQFSALERSHRVDALELFSRSTDRLAGRTAFANWSARRGSAPTFPRWPAQFGVARRTIIRDLQELIRRGQLQPEVYPDWESPSEAE